jgi:peroxiredoxin family protein
VFFRDDYVSGILIDEAEDAVGAATYVLEAQQAQIQLFI